MTSWVRETIGIAVVAILVVACTVTLLPDPEGRAWAERFAELLSPRNYDWSATLKDSVWRGIARATLVSALVVGASLALVLLIGVPLGMLTVSHARHPGVRLVRALLDRLSGIPVLVWTVTIFFVFARQFDLLLVSDESVVLVVIASVAILCLGDHLLADVVARVADTVRELQSEPYLRTVRILQFGEWRHVLIGLVPPLSNLVATRGVFLISAAIITERFFNLRGLGWVVAETLGTRAEPPVVLAASASLVLLALTLRALQRAALVIADPRQR